MAMFLFSQKNKIKKHIFFPFSSQYIYRRSYEQGVNYVHMGTGKLKKQDCTMLVSVSKDASTPTAYILHLQVLEVYKDRQLQNIPVDVQPLLRQTLDKVYPITDTTSKDAFRMQD